MKSQIIGSLTATLLISAFSASPTLAQQFEDWQPSSSDGQQIDETPVVSGLETTGSVNGLEIAFPSNPDTSVESYPIQEPALLLSQSSTAFQGLLEPSGITLVNAHVLEGRQAATVYVRNLPMLTFLGAELGNLEASITDKLKKVVSADNPATLEMEPVIQATSVGVQLNELYENGVDAHSIGVRWDTNQEKYIVTVAEEDLIVLNDQAMLPDTTRNAAEDALQLTNRLRRLLGGAHPITEIEGRPQRVTQPVETVAIVSSTVGLASWYGPGFHGRQSASGERFNQNAMTAAHRSLPFGTRVRVTNLNNGRQVVVRINDRGPYSGRRVIDLSAGAADQIGLTHAGVGQVRIEVLR